MSTTMKVRNFWAVTERKPNGGWSRHIFKTEAHARAFAAEIKAAADDCYPYPCYKYSNCLYPVNQ